MFVVPTFQNTSSKYTIEAELNNEVFLLKFAWNTRASDWYMSIYNDNGDLVLTDVKMVINYQLLRQYKAIEGIPKGDFILHDLEKDDVNSGVTFDNFGIRYQLVFFTNEEIEAGGI